MMSTPRGGHKLGLDTGEEKEFLKALKQPLMVQTPLQVILETLFARMQSQAGVISELSDKVERLVLKSVDADEMLDRVRLVEQSVKGMGSVKLSPFTQQDIVRRLEALENNSLGSGLLRPGAITLGEVAGTGSEDAGISGRTDVDAAGKSGTLEARLLRLEQKLAGVYNLNGKLLAVERMAGEMGIEIPDLEYGVAGGDAIPAFVSSSKPGSTSSMATISNGSTLNPSTSSNRHERLGSHPPAGSPPNHVSRSHASQFGSQRHHQQPGGGDVGNGGRPQSGNRLAEMAAGVAELEGECDSLRVTVSSLRAEVEELGAALASSRTATDAKFESVAEAAAELASKFDLDLTTVWKEIRKVPEVSFADYVLLKGRVEEALSQATSHSGQVEAMRNTELPAVMATFADLKDQIKKAFEPRDLDSMFHQRVTNVEDAIKDLRGEVQLSMGEALQGGVRPEDLAAIEEAINSKASGSDLRQLSQQQASLAQSVNNMAEWLSVRPETTDGLKNTGSAITKFKCMTCDRDMKTQSFSAGTSQSPAKGSFLPRLEAMQGTRDHAAPTGPGLNAAELRRMADEKLTNSWSGGRGNGASPPRGVDFDDYGANGQGGSRGASPPRVAKPSGRVAIQPPATKVQPAMGPAGIRTPVFF